MPKTTVAKMTKVGLVDYVVAKFDGEYTKKTITTLVDAALDGIVESLKKGEVVQIKGFGNFKVQDRPAHKARNPFTGTEVDVPAKKAVKFRPSKELKESV